MGFLLYHKLSRTWKVQASRIIGNRTAHTPFWNIIRLNDLPRSPWPHRHICALPARHLLSRDHVGVQDTNVRDFQPPWENAYCLVSLVTGLKGPQDECLQWGDGAQGKRASLVERRAGRGVLPGSHVPEADVWRRERAGTLGQGVRTRPFRLACHLHACH